MRSRGAGGLLDERLDQGVMESTRDVRRVVWCAYNFIGFFAIVILYCLVVKIVRRYKILFTIDLYFPGIRRQACLASFIIRVSN